MPNNNMDKSNKGQGMQDRNAQGQFTDDRNRNASNPNQNKGYGKDTGSGRQGSSSQSSEHMSEIGRKGGQH